MFNATAYVFMRHWYCPELPGISFEQDQWFAVPAVLSGTTYTLPHNKFELASLMIIGDNKSVVKALRAPNHKTLDPTTMMNLQRRSFDIAKWEKDNNDKFPYGEMFESGRVTSRYAQRHSNGSAFLEITSEDPLYTHIRSSVGGRPCNCGR